MASKKAKSARTGGKKGGGVTSKLGGAAIKALSGGSKSSGGRSRRSRGPAYWANKVIVEKLKKRYRALKYGSVR